VRAPVLETTGLGVRYRRGWALRDCSLSVPAGRVAALVGPNGAGKTTLMHAAVGLIAPAEGNVMVRGRAAFVAQDKPLYDTFTVGEMLEFGRRTNVRWDDRSARARLAGLGVPLDRRVGRLSGGQQAQVALTIALARRPDLLVLDEPLANLDPLARHDVMRSIMGEVAEHGLSVLLSSHVISDLEDTCDWLVVLGGGRLQVSGDIEELLAEHLVLTGPAEPAAAVLPTARTELSGPPSDEVVRAVRTGRQLRLLVRGEPVPDPRWNARRPNLEELVMEYLRAPAAAVPPGLRGVAR